MTAKEYLENAFTEIGVLIPSDNIPVNDRVWALGKFNRCLKSVASAGVALHLRITDSFPMVIGTQSYTIGTGATINTLRPNVIDQAYVRIEDTDYAVNIRPIHEYHGIINKSTPGRPFELFYDPTYDDETDGTIYLYYVPDSIDTMYLISQKPLTTYTDEDSDVVLPGEYEEALVLALAVAISPRFGKRISSDLRINSMKAWQAMIGRNLADQMRGVNMNITGRETSGYNIATG
jgi:hypothetical protein